MHKPFSNIIFIHMSNLHFGKNDYKDSVNLLKSSFINLLTNFINLKNPLLIPVITGELVYNNLNIEEYKNEIIFFFQEIEAIFMNKPLIATKDQYKLEKNHNIGLFSPNIFSLCGGIKIFLADVHKGVNAQIELFKQSYNKGETSFFIIPKRSFKIANETNPILIDNDKIKDLINSKKDLKSITKFLDFAAEIKTQAILYESEIFNERYYKGIRIISCSPSIQPFILKPFGKNFIHASHNFLEYKISSRHINSKLVCIGSKYNWILSNLNNLYSSPYVFPKSKNNLVAKIYIKDSSIDKEKRENLYLAFDKFLTMMEFKLNDRYPEIKGSIIKIFTYLPKLPLTLAINIKDYFIRNHVGIPLAEAEKKKAEAYAIKVNAETEQAKVKASIEINKIDAQIKLIKAMKECGYHVSIEVNLFNEGIVVKTDGTKLIANDVSNN